MAPVSKHRGSRTDSARHVPDFSIQAILCRLALSSFPPLVLEIPTGGLGCARMLFLTAFFSLKQVKLEGKVSLSHGPNLKQCHSHRFTLPAFRLTKLIDHAETKLAEALLKP